jgi:hypothetical protein
MDTFNGYPFTKAPVTIGSHVWITANSSVLPGVKIGSHIVIGNGSLVNRDIPDGCFAAGSPVNIIKEKIYPKKLDTVEKRMILKEAIEEYLVLLSFKNFEAEVELLNELKIKFTVSGRETIFDCDSRKVAGNLDEFSEDFRDFLRYRGIKFFTGKPFTSIKPEWFVKLSEEGPRGSL